MAGVVIVHASEDAAPAHALAAKLHVLGHEVVTDLTPGGPMRHAVMDADAVIALWSPHSVSNLGLVAETGIARGMGRLIHARMHSTPAPGDFVADPSIDLTGWRGEDSFPGWLNLRAAVDGVVSATYPGELGDHDFGDVDPYAAEPERRLSERAHRERELAQRAYDREQERYDDPPRRYAAQTPYRPRDPAAGQGGASPIRLALIGLVTFVVVAGVGIGAYSMIQGGRSAAAADSAWSELDKANPLAIRAFIDGQPGRYREPAEAALEGLEIEDLGRARQTDTIDAYQRFLTLFPQTAHSAEIRGRIGMLRARERDQTLVALDAPKPGEEPDASAVGGPSPVPLTTEESFDDLSPGMTGPVPLSPPSEDDLSTEEQLHREISGANRLQPDN